MYKIVQNNLFLVFCVAFGGLGYAQNIENTFPLKWKAKVGQTTYRSNIIFANGKIWLGSNGNSLSQTPDDLDAVFGIEPQNGKITDKITPIQLPENADSDINGIAIEGSKLYFGTDAKTLYAYDLTQKSFLWTYKAPKDSLDDSNYNNFESCPLLVDLNNDEEKDIVANLRGKGTVAINGKTGNPLWLNVSSNAEGAYLTSPVCIDVNSDATPDIITGGWDFEYTPYLYALNGKNGEILWQYNLGSGLKSSPVLVKKGKKTAIMVATTYSVVHLIDLTGSLLYYVDFQMPNEAPAFGGISGLYASPALSPNETLLIGSAWWSDANDGVWLAHLNKAKIQDNNGKKEVDRSVRKFYTANRVTASAVVGQFTSKNWQFAVPTERGELLIYDEKTQALQRYKMPSGSECTPLVADIDGDKKLELLIASYDGYLYCYQLPRKKAKIFTGQFRQNNLNQALIQLK
ncbi:MAG: hypothetical protein SFU27_00030 [Thermonemataceae bacterium]|nr:hypothetical protein [Thermonemataceae bacterium]